MHALRNMPLWFLHVYAVLSNIPLCGRLDLEIPHEMQGKWLPMQRDAKVDARSCPQVLHTHASEACPSSHDTYLLAVLRR